MPDSIKFSELPSGTLGANSIFATAEEAGGGAYASTKINTANLGNYLTGVLQYAGINTEDKTVEGALNELLTYASNIADEYDSTATYDVDDFVIHSGVLYKCITAISTPEAWTSAHWTSTLIVDNFGSGGASVTLGTTVPLDASGSNGDLYVQYDGTTYAVIEYYVKINNSWRKAPYSRVVALTQAEYNLITPDPTTLYIITDAQSSYQTKTDSNLQTTAQTVVGAINELKGDVDANFDYGLNEVVIGDYFGIPLYRKYFEIGNLPNNTTKTVEILDFNIRDVIDFRCIAKTTNSQSFVTLPYVSTQSTFNILVDIEATGGKTKVNVTTQMDRSGMVAFGIIDYLKWSN